MKKLKKISYIVLIVIVVVLSLTIYTNASKNDEQDEKEKILSEIKFIETKLINVLNAMNNIKVGDFNIVTTEISKESSNGNASAGGQSQGEQSQGGQSQGGEQSKQGETSQSGQESSNDSSGEQSKKTQEKFDLKENEILTNENQEINWNSVKSDIENLYDDLPSITMDLYKLNTINQEDILTFNKEYDNLTKIVKEENKEDLLSQTTKLYEFLPKFLKSSKQDELYTTLVETKLNIFKAYSKLDKENWVEISNDIKSAIDVYSKLLTNTNIKQEKKSNITKGYIMINELQNSVNIEDKSVLLIKYRNLLEEINNM